MPTTEKQDVLYIGPNRKFRFIKCDIMGKHVLDNRGFRAWHILPRFVIPVLKKGRVFATVLVVTDISELPIDPTGKNDYDAPETQTCMDGLADLQNRSAGVFDGNGVNFVHLAIAILAIVIGIIAIVVLISVMKG